MPGHNEVLYDMDIKLIMVIINRMGIATNVVWVLSAALGYSLLFFDIKFCS